MKKGLFWTGLLLLAAVGLLASCRKKEEIPPALFAPPGYRPPQLIDEPKISGRRQDRYRGPR